MKKIDYIFIVLTYRNTDDLTDFIKSVQKKIKNFKIIIVNSYFDENSKSKFQEIANKYDCDFINVENKGYSYGNNKGIEYANEMYDYNFLVVSNPDIVIEHFDISKLKKTDIYCGYIHTRDNKMQNPMLVIENRFSDYLIYKGFKSNKQIYCMLGILINKIIRQMFLLKITVYKKDIYKIFQAHGSFIVFSKDSINKLKYIFDENVFLFGEEGILAKRCKQKNISIYFTPLIKCFHKEDGSMKLSNRNLNSDLKKSNIYYYEQYYIKNKKE